MATICLMTHEYPPMPGGVGVSSQRIARLFAEHGHQVHVCLFKRAIHPVLVGENIFSKADGAVTLHSIEFTHIDKEQEASSITQGEQGFLRYPGQLDALLSLKVLHERHQFSVVINIYLTEVGQLAAMFAKLHDLPLIASIRGNDIGKNIFSSHFLPKLQYILHNADVVTSVANDLLKVANSIAPLKHSLVINNSFDWTRLEQKSAPVTVRLKGLVIGCVGIFRYKKGLPQLLRALEKTKFNSEFSLLLVGDYLSQKEREQHQYWIEQTGMSSHIHMTGMVQSSQVFSYLQLMDIFVAPSLFSEGCPNTVLEAMSMKRAIIASDAGANSEILRHGHSALLYPQTSIEKLTNALQSLVDNPAERKRLGEGAYADLKARGQSLEWRGWEQALSLALAK